MPRPFLHVLAIILCIAFADGAATARAAEPTPSTDIVLAIGNLGHERSAERQKATQQLMKLAETNHEAVLAECVQIYRETKDPEVKQRLKAVMETVVERHLYHAPRGYLGVMLQRVDVQGDGRLVIKDRVMPMGSAWVSQVVEDSAAQKAGLQPNDFIIQVDGKRWKSGYLGFAKYIQSKRPGDRVKLSVLRGTSTNTVEAVLGELPKADLERMFPEERSQEFFDRWLKDQLEGKPGTTP